ncbi:glycosyltransferase [Mycolicibacterium stellerae]|uniref:glycosyltransferase n=1 Tax=Mycolicibacterium stellerae TaxID=2358193 RepID=UPI0038996316
MSAPRLLPSLVPPVRVQYASRRADIGILTPYPPTLGGLATSSAALSEALRAHDTDVHVIRVADGLPSSQADVVAELVNDSATSVAGCIDLLNRGNVAIIQYDYGVYGGIDGNDVVDVIRGLRVPSIVVVHTVLKTPTPHQHSVLAWIAGAADQVVVMSEVAKQRLCEIYGVDRRKVTTITHGAVVPNEPAVKRPSRPTILTWGLLRPGKGIERVIEAMSSLHHLPGRPRYMVVGPTHPDVLAEEGEAYRDALVEQVRRAGTAHSVVFDARYFNGAMLTALIQSAAVVALPYDSADQVSSSALADAIAAGRPTVATAFPHAVEVLRNGAGTFVDHSDPDALVTALRDILTQPRLAGSMAAEARGLAPDMAWPVVAGEYLRVAQRLIAERPAAT